VLGWLTGELQRDDRRRGGGGGGGQARIRLGRTGPRGRFYAKDSTGRMTSSVVKAKFVKVGFDAGRHIGAHLRYIQDRERGEQEKERRDFFDRDRNGIDRDEVERAMKENQSDRVAMHKLMLSPGDNKIDIRDYTRESMEALEKRMGHELDWYAVVHKNTEHHHAHVVIAGKIPDRERQIERREGREEAEWSEQLVKSLIDPEYERSADELRTEKMLDRLDREMATKEAAKERGDVYLDRWDFKELRDAGNSYRIRERSLDLELDRAYEREFGREREYEPERGREREYDQGRGVDLETSSWDQISQMFEADKEIHREIPGRGDSREDGPSRGDRGDRDDRDIDRGDDFGMGR
jgi:hypothetical protein